MHRYGSRRFPRKTQVSGGRSFEEKVLLRAATEQEFREYLRLKPELSALSKENLFAWARWNQPDGWNPEKPPTKLALEFFEMVRSKLTDKLVPFLRMYVSTGTPVDFRLGSDFWLECCGVRVTFDLTTNPRKRKGYRRANFILRIWDFAFRKLERLARKICREIEGKSARFAGSFA